MISAGKTSSWNKTLKNVAKCWNERELGVSKKATGPPKFMEWVAEEKLILKNHEEFPCHLPDGTRSTFLMVFSPDGSLVASTHGNHNVYVTDLRTGQVVKTLSGHPRTPWCIAFHPSSNQILASGCLGGQVRVWDLHGGSAIWNAESQTVIASLTFHPIDRVLVIASYNEIHFWDWSQEKPFAKCRTANEREKVRYVSFDSTGHKLVTGIANIQPRQSQWDRVSAPQPSPQVSQLEHERRITICYRYMVEQYEQLVERYIQLSTPGPGGSTNYYLRRMNAPPQTIDRGTDPMDLTTPSTSSGAAGPSTRCTVCSGDLVGRRRFNARSSSGYSSSSSSSSSSQTPPEEPRRPRGTNEITASLSSSQFLTPSPASSPLGRSPTPPQPTSTAPTADGQSEPTTPTFIGALERLNRFRAQVEAGRNIVARSRMMFRLSPSAPEDVNHLIDDPLTEALPPRPTLNTNLQPPRQRHHSPPLSLGPLGAGSRRASSTSPSHHDSPATAFSPPPTSSDQSSFNLNGQRLEMIRDRIMEEHRRRVANIEHRLNPARVVPPTGAESPSSSSAAADSGSGERDRGLFCPRGCTNDRLSFSRWASSSCLHHYYNRSGSGDGGSLTQASPADRLHLFGDSDASTTGEPPPEEPVMPARPASLPPRPTSPGGGLGSDDPATNDAATFDSSSNTDSSTAINRLRAQFRRLQSVYNNNRDRESHLLRVAAENAERRLISRLSNLVGRMPGMAGRGWPSLIFQRGHDLRSIRYGLQLLRRNIYTMSRVYRFSVDRRRLDRIWRLWLDLQGQIFVLQAVVRDDERSEDNPNPTTSSEGQPSPSTATTPPTTTCPPTRSEDTPTASSSGLQSSFQTGSPVFVRLVPVTPSCSSSRESSGASRPSRTPDQPSVAASTTTDDDSSESTPSGLRRGFLSGGLPVPHRRTRFYRSSHKQAKRPRFERNPGRFPFNLGSSSEQASSSRLVRNEDENDDAGNGHLTNPLSRVYSNWSEGQEPTLKRKPRIIHLNSSTLPASHMSAPRPSTSRLPFPMRTLRTRYQTFRSRNLIGCKVPRNLPMNQNSFQPQPGPSREPPPTTGGIPWNRESLRNRARHMLLLMLDSLTQFFENDTIVRNTNTENSNERVTNLISLLELASNLTDLLLAQLQSTSRNRRDSPTSRRRSHHSLDLGRGAARTRTVSSSSSSSGGIGAGGGATPATSSGSEGSSRMRLPLLMVNDGPVPPEPDVVPPPYPPRLTSYLLPHIRLTQYLHAHHQHNHHSQDESPEDFPTAQERMDVMYGRASLGPASSVFMTEAPSAPHHRVQVWDFTKFVLPDIDCPEKNVVVGDCKIHNDASVDISKDGSIIVTLLPAGRLSHITTLLGVYSLSWDCLGQCLYTTSFEQNAVSVSLSPTNRHLVVGLASRRISFLHSERQTVAQIFRLEGGKTGGKSDSPGRKGKLALIRDLFVREPLDFMSINCIRWFPVPGQGFTYGTNSGKLKILR